MHITKVELENIKSHADSTFEFTRGTTAITGPNGAGKTTIIEAIAWTLFDLLDYKKDEFLRRGAKKGWARVSFISGLDEREYTVHRDTGTGYYVIDPVIEERVADKKEDVGRFLRQHLGVGSGTDLESLFRHAVGVPQGTLTAIFLSTPAERKRTFDVLLKVEEYRSAAEELLKTQRFVESVITELDNKAHHNEGELTKFDEVNVELKSVETDLDRLSGELKKLRESEAAEGSRLTEFEAKEKAAETARQEKERFDREASQAKLQFEQAEAEFVKAQTASEMIDSLRGHAERHTAAIARLVDLERERTCLLYTSPSPRDRG
jgi:exonuclease SbcC